MGICCHGNYHTLFLHGVSIQPCIVNLNRLHTKYIRSFYEPHIHTYYYGLSGGVADVDGSTFDQLHPPSQHQPQVGLGAVRVRTVDLHHHPDAQSARPEEEVSNLELPTFKQTCCRTGFSCECLIIVAICESVCIVVSRVSSQGHLVYWICFLT